MTRDPARIISSFVRLMSSCKLYPSTHPSISEHASEALGLLRDYHIDNKVIISADGDKTLSVNGVIVPLETAEAKRFFQKMKQKEISRIVIMKDVRAEELAWLFADLGSFRCAFRSYESVAVRLKKSRTEELGAGSFHCEEIARVRHLYNDISVYKNVDMRIIDSIVGGLITLARKGAGTLKELAPTGDDSDRLLTHSYNVAMISILQAEHLGVGSSLLYDLGLAALVHDAGKTLLPQSLRDREDSLTAEGWSQMKQHPVLGAMLLSSLRRIPEIAAVVAFEHHLRYDGTGYPKTLRYSRKQHVITQIVAIADWFCALHEKLPHRRSLAVPEIAGLLAGTAGKEFNPLLVKNFLDVIRSG